MSEIKAGLLAHPFTQGQDQPRQNADGSYSTEVTRTVRLPTGEWTNVPTLWFRDNQPVTDIGQYDDDVVGQFAAQYERSTGNKFPRFGSLDEAVGAAKARSAGGGATQGLLSTPGRYQ